MVFSLPFEGTDLNGSNDGRRARPDGRNNTAREVWEGSVLLPQDCLILFRPGIRGKIDRLLGEHQANQSLVRGAN